MCVFARANLDRGFLLFAFCSAVVFLSALVMNYFAEAFHMRRKRGLRMLILQLFSLSAKLDPGLTNYMKLDPLPA